MPATPPPVVAVDVVIVPPVAVRRRAIAESARLGSAIRLGPTAVPHVTLAMASVRRESLAGILSRLREIAAGVTPLAITLTRAVSVPSARHVTAWYEVARRRDLLALHREAVRALEPHRHGRATRNALALEPRERVSVSTLRWIDRFGADAAFGRYRPHVTLGYGEPAADRTLPLTFRASRIAVFQLGNHCTCARLLAEIRLSGRAVL